MDKAKIQLFSDTVREKLFSEIQQRMIMFGINLEKIFDVDQEFEDSIVINGKVFDKKIKEQRERLIKEINERGYEQVIDEVTYTWFNRFIALKYMEVNGYLPVRVVSSKEPGKLEPDIIKEALNLNFLDVDRDVVLDLKSAGKTEELYKYLVLKMCNYLNEIMPFLFEKIDDYTELLFPDKLLHTDSILSDLDNIISTDDWKEVEIIGWIYQSYIAKEKDKLIQAKKKYKENEIAKVTQLFTPKWIVRYMVQNSLGRYWLESHPNEELQSKFDFYLEPREENYLDKLKDHIDKNLNPEEITFIDPAMGSGHILVYAFEVFYEIYKIMGYLENEIPELILSKNLFGLEIDDRAAQLAGFALLMKARQYDKNLFEKKIELNLVSIQESNSLSDEDICLFAGNERDIFKVKQFFDKFNNAKIFGSIIKVEEFDKDFFEKKFADYKQKMSLTSFFTQKSIENIFRQAELMTKKYNVSVTNPPYLNSSYMPDLLKKYVKNHYPDNKSDLFAVFIEYMSKRTTDNGHVGMVTPYVWMFLKTYEKLRSHIIENNSISSLIQLEYNAFEPACVPVCTFTIRNYDIKVSGEYIKLSEFRGSKNQPVKTLETIKDPNVDYRYTEESQKFSKIPGSPIAYWVNDKVRNLFDHDLLVKFAQQRTRMSTGDNNRFLRYWPEVNYNKLFYANTWIPYSKGGPFRRWFGNYDLVLNYENDGDELENFKGYQKSSESFYFKKGLTWSSLSNSLFSIRILPEGFISDAKGPMLNIPDYDSYNKFLLGIMNSKVVQLFLNFISPTLDYNWGSIANTPILFPSDNSVKQKIDQLTQECIDISKEEWDSRETSWDFKANELIRDRADSNNLEISYNNYCECWKNKFFELHKNEEELNKIFIDIYDLNDELTPDVPLEEITILKNETKIENGKLVFKKDVVIKQFLSYFVGCLFGRYSPNKEGLILSNNGETLYDFKEKVPNTSFFPDDDNIIPALGDEYFEDDIVYKFKEFLKITFGDQYLSENLDFIANALSKKGKDSSEKIIRKYFMNDFFKDHCKMYKKRPIYWLFTSGPEKAFNALIYMHRYDKTTLAKMRTDYLNELQAKLEAKKSTLKLDSTDTLEKNRAQQELVKINKQLEETVEYHKLLKNKGDQYIEIDLDDGVKVNYEKFKGLVAKV